MGFVHNKANMRWRQPYQRAVWSDPRVRESSLILEVQTDECWKEWLSTKISCLSSRSELCALVHVLHLFFFRASPALGVPPERSRGRLTMSHLQLCRVWLFFSFAFLTKMQHKLPEQTVLGTCSVFLPSDQTNHCLPEPGIVAWYLKGTERITILLNWR